MFDLCLCLQLLFVCVVTIGVVFLLFVVFYCFPPWESRLFYPS